MNFTFEIKVNNVFGKKLPNGTWIGEIGKCFNIFVDYISDYKIFRAKRGDKLLGSVNKDIKSFNIYNCGRPRS